MAPHTGVMFKHEGHDDDGRAVGPVYVSDGGEYRRYADSEFGQRGAAAWFDLKTAHKIAADYGVSLEEV